MWAKNFNMKKFYIALIGLVLCIHLIFMKLLWLDIRQEEISSIVEGIQEGNKEYPIALWWTPITKVDSWYRKCGEEICFFTNQKKYLTDSLTSGLLFYGSFFNPTNLPLPRMPNHEWALLHDETPMNNYLFSFEEVLLLFNHSSTFRRESDLPITLQHLESLETLTSKTYFIPTEQKFSSKGNLAPVVYVQSHCNASSGRDIYVEELSKYIKVDSYGKCLHNKDLPKSISGGYKRDAAEFWKILSPYKFSLAFENAVCNDYITEKLWRPLILGSIPIYYGSPTIEDWLPNPESAILIKNFAGPKQLAEHLLRLSNDSVAYDMHLEHKLKDKITNKLLIDTVKNRSWGINYETEQHFFKKFECLVCERVAENYRRELKGLPKQRHQVTFEHYGCPKPKPHHFLEQEMYEESKYEAFALENLMRTGAKFSVDEFNKEVIRFAQMQINVE